MVSGSDGPGTNPELVAAMPSLSSSRHRAGQPTVVASRCASVVFPDPAGPLTIIKIGRPACGSVTVRSFQAMSLAGSNRHAPSRESMMHQSERSCLGRESEYAGRRAPCSGQQRGTVMLAVRPGEEMLDTNGA